MERRPQHDLESSRHLARESRALLEALADRLPPQHLEHYRSYSAAGEWVLLVNGLCGSLVRERIPITPAERDAVAAVLASFSTPVRHYDYINDRDGTLAALNVVAPRP